MTKEELRKESLKKRSLLQNQKEKDSAIHQRFLAQDYYQSAKTIMTYLSYKSEPDTHSLLKQMLSDGKCVCAPVCGSGGQMESYAFSDLSCLAPSTMGILEPTKEHLILPKNIDLIIVPGCAFNEKGHRLGYGGGYYDRYLLRTDAVTCGFFYDILKSDFQPEQTDVSLNFIITETRHYCF